MCVFKCPVNASALSPCSVGVAFGLIKGLWLLVLAWTGWLTGYGLAMVNHINQFYPSYTASLEGGLIGFFFGFICAFIFGLIFGWIYNLCLRCCQKRSSSDIKN